MIYLYNTLKHKKEAFRPLHDKKVGIYTCGPTVYWYAHIGNLRTYIFEDILVRVLKYNGYKVNRVMNITDVGHLTSNADTGKDKLEEGAKREKKTVWEIADFYTKTFKKDLKRLNIIFPDKFIKATDTIKDQINLIKILEKKGYTYKTNDGIYFDTSKLKHYGRLWGKKEIKMRAGFRVKMVKGKKHLTDFALWKFSPKNVKRQMEWPSPWGIGFPGWHTECVVMSIKELGIPFDIHCGGIDHILIHHTNEIAQAEAAYNKIMARYWLHGEFLVLKKGKMSKSEGHILTIDDLIAKGFTPLSYRYLCLTCHYRKQLVFSIKSLSASQKSLNNIYDKVREIVSSPLLSKLKVKKENIKRYKEKFLSFINDDLNTPRALALTQTLLNDKKLNIKEKYSLLLDFDKIFGLGIDKIEGVKIPDKVKKLVEQRENLRKQHLWKEADTIRKNIEKLGFSIKDTPKGPQIIKYQP